MDQTTYPEYEGKCEGYDQPPDYTQQVNDFKWTFSFDQLRRSDALIYIHRSKYTFYLNNLNMYVINP